MNYNYLVKNRTFNHDALERFGFVSQQGKFCYREDLLNGLFVTVEIDGENLNVEVVDGLFGERYAPFYSGHGGGAIKSQVREILERIFAACCGVVDVKKQVVEYMRSRYGTQGEFPWEDDLVDCVFKTNLKCKWYAIIMLVKQSSLGLPGMEKVDVINVKIATSRIPTLVDNVRYFPAYHMNKKNWITILLDKNADFAAIKQLIDDSYALVEGLTPSNS